jgi:hypothetical protein
MHIQDIRDQLPLNHRWHGATIGTRGQTWFITLHYNGPEVPAARQSRSRVRIVIARPGSSARL